MIYTGRGKRGQRPCPLSYLKTMFEAVTDKLNVISGMTVKELYRMLFDDKEFTDLIIELNTIGQLYTKGINSDGESIGEYSEYTKDIKYEKGQPYDRVTLRDTGEFYDSFKCVWNDNDDGEILITADSIKDDGKDLLVEWGKDILGLDEDSISQLQDMARIKIPEIIQTQLKQAA